MTTRATAIARPSRSAEGVGTGIGLGLIAVYVGALSLLVDRTDYDVWGALLVAPVLVALTLPMLSRQARRQADPTLFRLFLLALILKLCGAVARYYVAFTVYGGTADAQAYHEAGTALGERFRHLDFTVADVVSGGEGTRAAKIVAGAVYSVIGPTKMGAFLVFSWFGFLGLFFFYRAFVLAVPNGRPRTYAHLLFFLPSLMFWPSSLGKEAWMMLTLGLASLGVAKIMTGDLGRGLVIGALGVLGAGAVRPHIAGLVGVALAFAVVTRKTSSRLRELAPVVKVATVGAVVVLAAVLVVRTDQFLQDNGIETEGGLVSAATSVEERTSSGGSEFTPVSVVDSPLNAPIAAITVLFRPFPTEAHNAQSFASAMEGTLLMLIVLLRARWGIAAVRELRECPYLVFALVYSALFIVAFSSFSNFGLLARERVQLYPLFLMLISIPPAGWPRPADRGPRRHRVMAGA